MILCVLYVFISIFKVKYLNGFIRNKCFYNEYPPPLLWKKFGNCFYDGYLKFWWGKFWWKIFCLFLWA